MESEFFKAYMSQITFGLMQPGELFRFPNGATVFTKLRNGWMKDSENRRWRTGAGTAVIPVRKAG